MKKSFLVFSTSLIAALLVSFTASAYQIQNNQGRIQITLNPRGVEVSGADILFVIDDSGSMSAHQENLVARLKILTSSLAESRDANIGVLSTTSDQCNKPGNCGAVLWTSTRQNDWQNTLERYVKVGNNGSPTEQHFDVILKAIRNSTTLNAGFFRSHADLVVIFLTDAEDQSNIAVDAFITELRNFKGPKDVALHGIISDGSSACSAGEYPPERLNELLQKVNGITAFLCDINSLTNGLETITADIRKRVIQTDVKTLKLPTLPNFSTIAINYGGKPLFAGDAEYGWSYSRSNNTLIFGSKVDWTSEPEGTLLQVEYVSQKWFQ